MASNIALYRKYRPNCFLEIEGQEFVVKTLMNSIVKNKINHAYIFSGTRGIGKTSIAKIFAKAINCLNSNNGDCCNECKNCLAIVNSSLDIIEIDAASNNGVEDVRVLVDNVLYLPIELKFKVYIIDEAHMLTNPAWNAFLKTIEEPPKHTVFIFATTEFYKIPLTILSRCQKFALNHLSDFDLSKTVKKIIDQEDINIEEQALKKIISLSRGSARDCLTFLGQLDTFTNSNIKLIDVNNVFGLIDLDEKITLVKNIVFCQYEKVLVKINEFEHKGIDFYQLAVEIIEILFDKLVYEKTKNDKLLKVLSAVNYNFVQLSASFLIQLIDIWQENLFKMKNDFNQKFFFELACLSGIKIFDFESNQNYSINAEDEVFVNSDVQNEFSQYKNVSATDILVKKTLGNNSAKTISENKIEKKVLIDSDLDELQKNILSVNEIDKLIEKCIKINAVSDNEYEIKDNNLSNEFDSVITEIEAKDFIASQDSLFSVFDNDDINEHPLPKPKEIVSKKNNQQTKLTKKVVEKSSKQNNNVLGEKKDLKVDNQSREEIIDNFKKSCCSIATKNNGVDQLNFDKYDLFYKIADNTNNDLKTIICNKFKKIKDKSIAQSNEENYLIKAKKVVNVSSNAIILEFENEIDARNLNEIAKETIFLKYVNDNFKKIYLFLGLTKKEINAFVKKYKNDSKDIKTKSLDVDISNLSEKMNKKPQMNEHLLNVLSDLIIEKG